MTQFLNAAGALQCQIELIGWEWWLGGWLKVTFFHQMISHSRSEVETLRMGRVGGRLMLVAHVLPPAKAVLRTPVTKAPGLLTKRTLVKFCQRAG